MAEFAESCCCSPTGITGMPGGIHPDHINTAFVDAMPLGSGDWVTRTQPITFAPVHIIGGSVSYYAKFPGAGDPIPEAYTNQADTLLYAYTPLNVSLFTIDGFTWDAENYGGFIKPDNDDAEARGDSRQYIWTGCLNPGGVPSLNLPSHLWGYFCDGGVHIEIQCAASVTVGARVCLQYVDRVNFGPAYASPTTNNKTRWACMNPGEDFLDGFYGGTVDDPGPSESDSEPSESIDSSSLDISSDGSFGSGESWTLF